MTKCGRWNRVGMGLAEGSWIRMLAVFVAMVGSGCTDSLVDTSARRVVATRHVDFLNDDGIHAFLCGTGIPMAVRGRAGACTAVLVAGQFILIDTGPGSWANIADDQLPASRLSAVLLTHFHSDHIADLGEVATQSWMLGREGPLDIYGPEGVEQVVAGFDEAYTLDRKYRTALFGKKNLPSEAGEMRAHPVALLDSDGTGVVLDRNGLKVVAFAVNHGPAAPAYGYRFEYKGKVLVISGDTSRSDNLVKHAADADVLIQEVAAKNLVNRAADDLAGWGHARLASMARDALTGHTSPAEAVEMARDAGVKKLVFTHIAPSLPNWAPDFISRWLFFGSLTTGFEGDVIFGKDEMWINAGQ